MHYLIYGKQNQGPKTSHEITLMILMGGLIEEMDVNITNVKNDLQKSVNY